MATAANEAIAFERGGSRKTRVRWAVGVLAALVVATVAVVAVTVVTSPAPVPAIDEQGRVSSLYSADELTVMRLAAKGYIPDETLNGEPFLIKRLVNQGLVPRETLRPNLLPGPSLYSAPERALMTAGPRDWSPRRRWRVSPSSSRASTRG